MHAKPPLTETHPDICKEWDPALNEGRRPEDYTHGCHTYIVWKCAAGHLWKSQIKNRLQAIRMGWGCPYCSGRKASPETCLLATHPELCKEWDVSLNGGKRPEDYTRGSSVSIIWKCQQGHEWKTPISSRALPPMSGCPFCKGKRATPETCLLVTHPELCEQWDHARNGARRPEDYTRGSGAMIQWKCSKGHEWRALISSRAGRNGRGCPFCGGKRPTPETSLRAVAPSLAAEWHERNLLTPDDVLPQSNKKFWWRCPDDPTHEYLTSPNSRGCHHGSGCPRCAAKSKGEEMVAEYLAGRRILFSREARFHSCRHKHPLPFDFKIYHMRKMGLIEFQGIQHYDPEEQFGREGPKALERFNRIQHHDRIKETWCECHAIPFLAIPYTEIGNLDKIISDWLLYFFECEWEEEHIPAA